MMRWGVFDPFDVIREIQKEINELFDHYPLPTREKEYRTPFTDVFDEGDKYVITVELPGVRKEDIKLRATDDTIEIKAELKKDEELKEENIIKIERAYKGYYRLIKLPEEIIPEKVKARYNNGILEITAPKKHPTKEDKGRFIPVE